MPVIDISEIAASRIRRAIEAGDVSTSVADILGPELEMCQCDRCDTWVREATTVDGTVEWCNDCAESYAYCWDSGEYHSEPEPEDVEDDIPDYHDGDRDALNDCIDWARPDLIGVELETYCQYPEEDRAAALDVGDCLGEKDSSLDKTHGVEFVFRATTLAQIHASAEHTKLQGGSGILAVASVLKRRGAIAWDAGDGYGMHISINAGALTELHCAKFCRFVNDNQVDCEMIAGRKENRWARYSANTIVGTTKDRSKYVAAARRDDNRIEVRIFRASLNPDRIVRNCEFVDSVRVFTESASYGQLTFDRYREWLAMPSQSRYQRLRKFYGIVKTRGSSATASLTAE